MRAAIGGALLLAGCGLLSPRVPQPPEPGEAGGYQQPTTAAAVVENMRLAVAQRDAVLFLRCLVDTAIAPGRQYQFEPSGQAMAQYAALFRQWNREAERRSFVAMMSRVPSGFVPELTLIAPVFEVQTPDSAVFRADYQLYVPYHGVAVPAVARGRLRWTLVPMRDGTWAIQRWSDADAEDSTAVSWSILKALWSQ